MWLAVIKSSILASFVSPPGEVCALDSTVIAAIDTMAITSLRPIVPFAMFVYSLVASAIWLIRLLRKAIRIFRLTRARRREALVNGPKQDSGGRRQYRRAHRMLNEDSRI